MKNPKKEVFLFHNIRGAKSHEIHRRATYEFQAATEEAASTSFGKCEYTVIEGTAFKIHASFADTHDFGVAYLTISAGHGLAGGKIAKGTVIVEAAAAAHRATAPLAWRYVMGRYLHHVACSAASGDPFHAPGPMPSDEASFAVGFRAAPSAQLSKAEHTAVSHITFAAVRHALLHCEAAMDAARREGREPARDPLDPDMEEDRE